MALLAEEVVEEWLNRQGYFTIRGIKIGVQEVDLLALRVSETGNECRHIEVQASVRPVSYISSVPKELQRKTGRKPGSAKARTPEELRIGIQEWIEKKFLMDSKCRIREALSPGAWSFELVVHKVRHPVELKLFAEAGVIVHSLSDIVRDLASSQTVIRSAAGASLVDLVMLDAGQD